MKNSIGEESVTPQAKGKILQDITPQALQSKMAGVMVEKNKLDYILKGIADKVGADFESRTKNPDTALAKIAQKRSEGRGNYSLGSLNDLYGARFIIKKPGDAAKIKSLLDKAESLGLFKIIKQQSVKTGTYHANHTDFQTPQGVKGEIQTKTPQEHLESVANHSIRSVFGEKPPPQVALLRDKQAAIASKTGDSEAMKKASAIQSIAQQNGGKSVDPRLIATILKGGGQNAISK